ncbi:MAG: hypothetical protein AAFN68_08750, partial [Pseudomonadota bacterium]
MASDTASTNPNAPVSGSDCDDAKAEAYDGESVLFGSSDPNDPLLSPAATRQLVFWTSGLVVTGLFLSI